VTASVQLREVDDDDLQVFFEQQSDRDANWMVAFMARDPSDRVAFDAHWAKIRSDPAITIRTIVFERRIAGNVASFLRGEQREVCYWIGKEFWGRGIATAALALLLKIVSVRPLYARVAKDNVASLCVLQKCGFTICGEDRGYANARGTDIEEFILKLDANHQTRMTP